MNIEDTKNIVTIKIWGCDRCKITSEDHRMCPCIRGNCSAKIIGTKEIITIITLNK